MKEYYYRPHKYIWIVHTYYNNNICMIGIIIIMLHTYENEIRILKMAVAEAFQAAYNNHYRDLLKASAGTHSCITVVISRRFIGKRVILLHTCIGLKLIVLILPTCSRIRLVICEILLLLLFVGVWYIFFIRFRIAVRPPSSAPDDADLDDVYVWCRFARRTKTRLRG